MCKRNVTPPVRAGYRPFDWLARDAELRRVVTCIREGAFNQGEFGLFDDIYRALTEWGDTFFHLADFRSYANAQQRASDLHRDPTAWARKAVLNVARMGRFSSNRTIPRARAGDLGFAACASGQLRDFGFLGRCNVFIWTRHFHRRNDRKPRGWHEGGKSLE